MSLSDYNNDMSIASGVMAALAVVYGGYLAGNWNRRQGKVSKQVQSKLERFINSLENHTVSSVCHFRHFSHCTDNETVI